MSTIDLHIHSNISLDGELSVEEIIKFSKANGVEFISITDHNSVRGVEIAKRECEKYGIYHIPGIEIDCEYEILNLHILGYNINFHDRSYAELESYTIAQDKKVIPEMLSKLKKLGFMIDEDDVYLLAGNQIPSPELIAEALLNKSENHSDPRLQPYISGGSKSDMPYLNFYRDYFKKGKPAFVKKEYLHVQEIIDLIKISGGVAVLAHPGESLNAYGFEINDLIKLGINGIEVFSSYHNHQQTEFFLNVAVEKNLIISCGSDFHGKNKPTIKIGSVNCNDHENVIKSNFAPNSDL